MEIKLIESIYDSDFNRKILDHQEIRFRILYNLYEKYYGGQLGRPQVVEEIISESGLTEIDKQILYADVLYLENKGLVKGEFILGYAHPPWIQITSIGIDFVESVVEELIEVDIRPRHGTNQANEILQEQDPVKRISKTVNYVQSSEEQWKKFMKITGNKFFN
jgi:hypothetical protein